MVVGSVQPADMGSPDAIPADRDTSIADLQQLLKELESASDWPIAMGCASGHCEPNMTLPLGLEARLDSARGTLTVG